MKKFKDYMSEDLNLAAAEPTSEASAQAKQLGLTYVGFGRYEDPTTQQVTYIVQNGRLVPFSKAVRTNSYQQQSGNDFAGLTKVLAPQVQQIQAFLTASYPAEKYDDPELDAIKYYTGIGAAEINSRLYSLPTGILANQIEPTGPGDNIPQFIAGLDSALNRGKTKDNILTYAILSQAFTPDMIKSGSTVVFKGYRSTTIDLSYLTSYPQNSTILQILIPKGSKGMYVDDYSSSPGESEFLLPRGSQVTITAGPSKLKGTMDNTMVEVLYYDAQLVS